MEKRKIISNFLMSSLSCFFFFFLLLQRHWATYYAVGIKTRSKASMKHFVKKLTVSLEMKYDEGKNAKT